MLSSSCGHVVECGLPSSLPGIVPGTLPPGHRLQRGAPQPVLSWAPAAVGTGPPLLGLGLPVWRCVCRFWSPRSPGPALGLPRTEPKCKTHGAHPLMDAGLGTRRGVSAPCLQPALRGAPSPHRCF